MAAAEWAAAAGLAAAALATWRWRQWKSRALRCRQELAAWKEALQAVAFESSNAVNAIRANLLDFREANSSPATPGHLDQIAAGTDRIAAILRMAEDPVSWRRQRKGGGRAGAERRPAAPMIGDPTAQ